MTKAEFIKVLEPYPDEWDVGFYCGDCKNYKLIKSIEVNKIEWIRNVNGIEQKPSIILK